MASEKFILRGIYVLSAIVLLAVVVLYHLPPSKNVPDYISLLPKLNAMINASCTAMLCASYFFIQRKHVSIHRILNVSTFLLSAVFLVSYVIFHSYGIETRFPADHSLRPVYLFILLTHIILASIVLPLVLVTFYFALTGNISRHRKIAKWTFPVWLYVTTTGVIVYLMISPYYKF